MSRILISGSNGQLGQEFGRLVPNTPEHDFFLMDSTHWDITNSVQSKRIFETIQPQFLINCAAYTKVDLAESEKDKCFEINHMAVESLALLSKEHNTQMVHISTDYVFHSETHRVDGMLETDLCKPKTVYGQSKLSGEIALKELWEKHYIIRSSWIYSEFGHNFVKTMLRLAQSKPEIHVVSDQMGSPTYALELAKGIIHLISTVNSEGHDLFGTYHFANQGSSTWFDFAKEIFKIQNLQTIVLPITTADFNAAASRPHYSVLNCDKFTSTFDYKIPQWEDSLKQCLYKMPNK